MKRLWLLLTLLLPLTAYALGEQHGRITGIVYSPEGAELACVKLTLTSDSLLGGPRTLYSSDDGSFSFNSLAPGVYDLKIEPTGLTTIIKTGIVVHIGKTVSLYLRMEPATSEGEVLVVPVSAPVLDTSDIPGGFSTEIAVVPNPWSVVLTFAQVPSKGQSLQSFALQVPRTEIKNDTLLLNNKPWTMIVDGMLEVPNAAPIRQRH